MSITCTNSRKTYQFMMRRMLSLWIFNEHTFPQAPPCWSVLMFCRLRCAVTIAVCCVPGQIIYRYVYTQRVKLCFRSFSRQQIDCYVVLFNLLHRAKCSFKCYSLEGRVSIKEQFKSRFIPTKCENIMNEICV